MAYFKMCDLQIQWCLRTSIPPSCPPAPPQKNKQTVKHFKCPEEHYINVNSYYEYYLKNNRFFSFTITKIQSIYVVLKSVRASHTHNISYTVQDCLINITAYQTKMQSVKRVTLCAHLRVVQSGTTNGGFLPEITIENH